MDVYLQENGDGSREERKKQKPNEIPILPKPSETGATFPFSFPGFMRMGAPMVAVGASGAPGAPVPSTVESDTRRQKKREASRRQTVRKQQARKEEETRRKNETFLGRVSSSGGVSLDEKDERLLIEILNRGEIQFGVTGFGDGGTEGLDNGYCFAILTRSNAPSAPGVSRRSMEDAELPFWTTSGRAKRVRDIFGVCSRARILLILEGDSPTKSVMGTAAHVAFYSADGRRGIKKLGQVGRNSGIRRFDLTFDFVSEACDGRKAKNLLSHILWGGQTWAIDNFEEDRKLDDDAYDTVESEKAGKLVQETSMGRLCFPKRFLKRGGLKGGSETVLRHNGSKSFGGSSVGTFLMSEGCVTNTHIDRYEVNGEEIDVPAAGTLWSVERTPPGSVKRAIVVCSADRDNVIQHLKLEIDNNATRQYPGPIKCLEELAAKLKKHKIRFVVVDFPPNCSYIIPPGCAHMFVTLGMVESSVWHPSL